MLSYDSFVAGDVPKARKSFKFVSLFSGAGIGDYGLKMAGGKCLAACEIDPNRAAVHKQNIGAPVWGNIRADKDQLVASLKGHNVDLLIATPPCQSFSTSNAKRGLLEDPEHANRDERNNLFFEALEVARALNPKIVFFENVPNFLKRRIRASDGITIGRVEDYLYSSLGNYIGWSSVICFSELGVPQRRKRSIAIFVRKDVIAEGGGTFPTPENWPGKLASTPQSILDALQGLPEIDGVSDELAACPNDFLHQVPSYQPHHYSWINDIPAGSGKSAWENACTRCGDSSTPIFSVECSSCGNLMFNRPYVLNPDNTIRPIKGFKTSYKRMAANEIAPTITTATGHFSSDLKLHPIQNRVLSARECALLQTIPSTFEWPAEQRYRKGYLIREMIGEAVPPLVTYRLGRSVSRALALL